MPNSIPSTKILRLRISLEGTYPEVWRRLEVPNRNSLPWFHCTLDVAMGWQQHHLFKFLIRGMEIGVPGKDMSPKVQNGTNRRLDRFQLKQGEKIYYVHNINGHWRHEILVEAILQPEPNVLYPRLIDGSGTCPGELSLSPYDRYLLIQGLDDEETCNPAFDIYWTKKEDITRSITFKLGPANQYLQRALNSKFYA